MTCTQILPDKYIDCPLLDSIKKNCGLLGTLSSSHLLAVPSISTHLAGIYTFFALILQNLN